MSALLIKSISAMEVCPLAEANIRAVFPSYTYAYTVINSSLSSYACRPMSMSMSMSMPMSTPDKRLEDDSVDVDEADTGTGKKRRVSLLGPESGGRELERKKSTGEASPTVADFNYWSNSDVAVLSSTSLQRSRRMPYKKYNVSWILLDSK